MSVPADMEAMIGQHIRRKTMELIFEKEDLGLNRDQIMFIVQQEMKAYLQKYDDITLYNKEKEYEAEYLSKLNHD